MVPVHPQDTVDVPLAARREAVYDCEFILDDVQRLVFADDGSVSSGEPVSAPAPVGPTDGGSTDGGSIGDSPTDLDQIAPLGRLAASVEQLTRVACTLQFRLDEHGRPRLEGTAQATVGLPCQRCLENVETVVTAELDAVVWLGDTPPTELSQAGIDVLLSRSSVMTYAALVEDDLLLALPQQVCVDQDCPRMPVLSFPVTPPGAAAGRDRGAKDTSTSAEPDDGALPGDRQRPFAGLKDLLDGQSSD